MLPVVEGIDIKAKDPASKVSGTSSNIHLEMGMHWMKCPSPPHCYTIFLTRHLPHMPPPSHTTSLTHHLPHTPPPSHTTSLTHHLPHTPPPSHTTSLTHHLPHTPPPSHTTSLTHHLPHTPSSHMPTLQKFLKSCSPTNFCAAHCIL